MHLVKVSSELLQLVVCLPEHLIQTLSVIKGPLVINIDRCSYRTMEELPRQQRMVSVTFRTLITVTTKEFCPDSAGQGKGQKITLNFAALFLAAEK